MWALPETQDFTLCFYTLLQSPSTSSYFSGFPGGRNLWDCGPSLPLSAFTQAGTELTSGSAPGGVATPRWHQEPTPKLQLLAPTPCPWISKIAYKWELPCKNLPAHLSTRGKTNQHTVFFHVLLIPRIACQNPSSFSQASTGFCKHTAPNRNNSHTNSLP